MRSVPPIYPEHLQFPEYQEGMFGRAKPESFFKRDEDGLYLEILLPKGVWYNDFDKSESLIETEDTTNGDRFWMETSRLFQWSLRLNCTLDLQRTENFNGGYFDPGHYQINWIYTAQCIDFKPVIRRKRCYIQARLKQISNPKPFFRSKQRT
jgi:hypothetical protein